MSGSEIMACAAAVPIALSQPPSAIMKDTGKPLIEPWYITAEILR